MQYTQNKVHALRRLLLGSLYDKCKEGGATREEMQEQLTRIQRDGQCLQGCSVDDLVNICSMKTRTVPTCFTQDEQKERSCMDAYREDEFKRRLTFPNSESIQGNWMRYTTAKLMENLPDDDSEDEDEEEEHKEDTPLCMICQVDMEDSPVITLPCRHTVHPACILHTIKATGKTTCPACKSPIPAEYTGNIRLLLQGKWRNYITMVNGVHMNEEPLTEDSLPFSSWLQFTATDEASKNTMATEEEKALYQGFLDSGEAGEEAERRRQHIEEIDRRRRQDEEEFERSRQQQEELERRRQRRLQYEERRRQLLELEEENRQLVEERRLQEERRLEQERLTQELEESRRQHDERLRELQELRRRMSRR